MSLAIFTNIVFPFLAGVFLLLCSVYFFGMRGEATRASRNFAWFLASFALFLIGRPVQILSGEHPWPLIVNTVRIFILCVVTMPMLVITAELNKLGRFEFSHRAVLTGGVVMGLVYAVFHAIGTTGTYPMFVFDSLTAYASTMPSFAPPWYGREVSLAVQVLIGVILFAGSAIKCLKILRLPRALETAGWRLVLLYGGVMSFGACFAVGSLLKLWAVYYVGAIVSAIIVGTAVIVDVYSTSRAIEKTAPFIKEAILRYLALSSESEAGAMEAFRLLGKSTAIDGFAILSCVREGTVRRESFDLRLHASLADGVCATLEPVLHKENYLLLPLAADTLGVAFLTSALAHDETLALFERTAARLASSLHGRIAVGIGGQRRGLAQLCTAYREALFAHEFAARNETSLVVHINSLKLPTADMPYPYKEQSELLLCVRLGDSLTAPPRAAACFEGLKNFSQGNPASLKLRLYAMAGLIVEATLAGGGDAARIEALNVRAYQSMAGLNDMVSMWHWLLDLVSEASRAVAEAQQTLSHGVFEQARAWLAENYQAPLTLEEVARQMAISPSYFAHLFKKESGSSFSKYLAEVRLTAAKQLLLNSHKSITEIALAVGYNDSNYFSTVFKNSEGFSPSEYRRMNKG
ncbi:MAG: transcriptional regulator, AraC family [Proteobacteria bacterium]|nr:transcriptional regulator, AraC family [Pseudomonadota bacterium]